MDYLFANAGTDFAPLIESLAKAQVTGAKVFNGAERWPYKSRDFSDLKGSRTLGVVAQKQIERVVAQVKAWREQGFDDFFVGTNVTTLAAFPHVISGAWLVASAFVSSVEANAVVPIEVVSRAVLTFFELPLVLPAFAPKLNFCPEPPVGAVAVFEIVTSVPTP